MSPEQERVVLADMVASARLAMSYAAGRTVEQFYAERMVQDAVTWRITVIGEGANRLSDDTRAAMPGLPWKQIVNMRHRLIHEYERVRLDIVWDTVNVHLSILAATLESFLRSTGTTGPRQS